MRSNTTNFILFLTVLAHDVTAYFITPKGSRRGELQLAKTPKPCYQFSLLPLLERTGNVDFSGEHYVGRRALKGVGKYLRWSFFSRQALPLLKRPFAAVRRLMSASPGSAVNIVNDATVEEQTMQWIHHAVIGLNLCPFAEKPITMNEFYADIVRGEDDNEVGEAVAAALLYHREHPGTTIVIAPDYYPNDFERYLAMVQFLEQQVMAETELEEHVQIAPFHPHFALDDDTEQSIDAYTNQSPYPMFHIIRVDEVDRAVRKLAGDPGKVWRRNKLLLQNLEERLGRQATVELFLDNENTHDDTRETLEQVLQVTNMQMKKDDGDNDSCVPRGVWIR